MKPISLIYFFISILLIFYSLKSSPPFPPPPPDSVQSMEEADTEIENKKAYFTNYEREQVVKHYQFHFGNSIRLNYPPEDSQFLIRDQTRSTFLEELVRPMRESLFINGFKPKESKDEIWYRGQNFVQKITIKYSASNRFLRAVIILLSMTAGFFVIKYYFSFINEVYIFFKNK